MIWIRSKTIQKTQKIQSFKNSKLYETGKTRRYCNVVVSLPIPGLQSSPMHLTIGSNERPTIDSKHNFLTFREAVEWVDLLSVDIKVIQSMRLNPSLKSQWIFR